MTKPTQRFGYADLINYALIAAEEIYCLKPKSFHKASQWRKLNLCGRTTHRCSLIYQKNKKGGIPGVEGQRFKIRLVAKGFTQVEGVDYNEIFSPLVNHCSIRILMSIVNQYNLVLEQLDMKTNFPHGITKLSPCSNLRGLLKRRGRYVF